MTKTIFNPYDTDPISVKIREYHAELDKLMKQPGGRGGGRAKTKPSPIRVKIERLRGAIAFLMVRKLELDKADKEAEIEARMNEDDNS